MFNDRDIVSQQIDEDGKTRVINFRTEINGERFFLSLFVPPTPPLNVKIDNRIGEAESLEIAQLFFKLKNIKLQNTKDRNIILGVYGDSYSVFLTKKRERDESKIISMRKNQKIAEFIKQYALYTYSVRINQDRSTDINDIFVIEGDHVYDIETLNKRLFIEDNEVMYDKRGRMIVTSREMRDRLLTYIKTNLKTNPQTMVDMRNKKTIETYYQGIVDFRQNEEEIVFTSRLGLLKWKMSLQYKDSYDSIFPRIIPFVKEPYYFRNFKIKNNRIMIVQNVEENHKQRALSVSHIWNKERINMGYSCPTSKERIPYTIFNSDGLKKRYEGDSGIEEAFIYEHTEENYSALLFI